MKSNSSLQTTIYIGIILILLLVAGGTLLIYYTQPFEENFKIKESVDFGDVIYQTNNYSGIETITSAQIDIGSLELSNEGYFERPYVVRNFFGCVNFTNENTNLNKQLQISLTGNTNSGRYNGYYYYDTYNPIEVQVGGKLNFNITAAYSSYGVTVDQFKDNRPTSIYVYEIPTKERNPLGNIDGSYNRYNRYYYSDCNNLGSLKPYKIIQIN